VLAACSVFQRKSIFAQLLPGRQAIRIREVHDIGLISFDLGYLDLETQTPDPSVNPFGPRVLPMS